MFKIGDYSMRPIERADLEQVLAWRNSERIRSVMINDHIITMPEHLAWFERIKKLETPLHFIFQYKGRPIGYLCFTDVDFKNLTCSSGMYLGEQTDLPDLAGIVISFFIAEYAFEKLGMRKLWGYAFAYNKKILKVNQLFGSKQEGYLVKHVFKNGKYEDLILSASFYEEWKERREVLKKYLFS